MSDRTLVTVTASENCIGFRTYSRRWGGSRKFLVTRRELMRLEQDGYVVCNDIYDFAVFHRDIPAGIVRVEFTWLRDSGRDCCICHREMVTLPWYDLMRFVRESSTEDGPRRWKTLSLVETSRPRLVFYDWEGLRKCVENRPVRRKLARFLRDHFNWPRTDEIGFYRDSEPYSFFFREITGGKVGICGAVILHGREDMTKAYYGIHT